MYNFYQFIHSTFHSIYTRSIACTITIIAINFHYIHYLYHISMQTVYMQSLNTVMLFCLFVWFESHEQFFSYLATVTITGDGAANLDLCLALTAFSSEGSFTCHTYCDTGPPFLRLYDSTFWMPCSWRRRNHYLL